MKPQAVVLFLLVSGSLSAGIDPGTFVGSVACEAEPQYSYALYLPSAYDPELRWPLILAFDPSGIGAQPVEGFRAAHLEPLRDDPRFVALLAELDDP